MDFSTRPFGIATSIARQCNLWVIPQWDDDECFTGFFVYYPSGDVAVYNSKEIEEVVAWLEGYMECKKRREMNSR
jgi:hypothetical protein